jgi:hypothetical protein
LAGVLASYPDAAGAEPYAPARQQPDAPLSAEEETAIRAWLVSIGETDPDTVTAVVENCRTDAAARAGFMAQAKAELPANVDQSDDRRTCAQCENMTAGRCRAALRGEITASPYYTPDPKLRRRCEGYAPGADDPDQRPGRVRWPGLTSKTIH